MAKNSRHEDEARHEARDDETKDGDEEVPDEEEEPKTQRQLEQAAKAAKKKGKAKVVPASKPASKPKPKPRPKTQPKARTQSVKATAAKVQSAPKPEQPKTPPAIELTSVSASQPEASTSTQSPAGTQSTPTKKLFVPTFNMRKVKAAAASAKQVDAKPKADGGGKFRPPLKIDDVSRQLLSLD